MKLSWYMKSVGKPYVKDGHLHHDVRVSLFGLPIMIARIVWGRIKEWISKR